MYKEIWRWAVLWRGEAPSCRTFASALARLSHPRLTGYRIRSGRALLINSRQEHLELEYPMKHTALFLLMAAATVAASAQTTAAKPATTSSTAARPATTAHASTATGIKLPPGVPPVRGILKTAFALKYQDIKSAPAQMPSPISSTRFTTRAGAPLTASSSIPPTTTRTPAQGQGRQAGAG